MKKRGQITLFVLLGIVILISFSFVLYLRETKERDLDLEAGDGSVRSFDGFECSQDGSCQATCSDGSMSGECSNVPSLFCAGGDLISNCQECGCIGGLGCLDNGSCAVICSDGSISGECSSTQPFFCDNGNLVSNCGVCGCPFELGCQDSGRCEEQEEFTIYFLPVNYDPDDSDFNYRVNLYQDFIIDQSKLSDYHFEIVPERFDYDSSQCIYEASSAVGFVDDWHQRRYGVSLDAVSYSGSIPLYNYRVIAIDKNQQDTTECGCGYILGIYGNSIYVGNHVCSRYALVAMHELGHGFGLCDEYDSCVWEDTNQDMISNFGISCPNSRPTSTDSDCGNSCCSTTGSACCIGKYAEQWPFYNLMGSANLYDADGFPIIRRFNDESRQEVDSFLCTYFNIC